MLFSMVMAFLIAPVFGVSPFSTRDELRRAAKTWMNTTQRPDLETKYGHIAQWDVSSISDMSEIFAGLEHFNEAIGSWNTSAATNMSMMFLNARAFNQSIGRWNTSSVRDMSLMFYNAENFSQDISSWDTSKVLDMCQMFWSAKTFNQPIGSWSTSNVRDMNDMFAHAAAFNQPIGSWITSNVEEMRGMFFRAFAFNQPIGAWDVSNVRDMSQMFRSATVFNQYIGEWKTVRVSNMSQMFCLSYAFNQRLGWWRTSRVTDMSAMFYHAEEFDQPIHSWDVSSVSNMRNMFAHASAFNQPLASWERKDSSTSSVIDMSGMFNYAQAFNQPIASWDTSSVRDMSKMFSHATAFNQDISGWTTSSVTDMSKMFQFAMAFNQPIGDWDTSSVTDMSTMFRNATAFKQQLVLWDTSQVCVRPEMFHGAEIFVKPPCPAGHFPAQNRLGCERCPAGRYSYQGQESCGSCPTNAVPSPDQTSCDDCDTYHFASENAMTCKACNLPMLLIDANCVWWHLPLLAVVVAGVLVGGRVWLSYRRGCRKKEIEKTFKLLETDLWDGAASTVLRHSATLQRLGVHWAEAERRVAAIRKAQSEKAGVSMRYLMSTEFQQLAIQRTGKSDPTFIEMQSSFWCEDAPLGGSIICPRDGRAGCALVDWIPCDERREQTHFLSWTWKYRLGQVRSALGMYRLKTSAIPEQVFFFMCFFVNNQFRILVEQTQTGSADLETVFESNLKRIGRMVAILDGWENPLYFQRIWTVYEQFVASTLDVQVSFAMPPAATTQMNQQIYCGKVGIKAVTRSLSQIDSANAKASKPQDEDYVKSLIERSVGFAHVDHHVTQVMVKWIGNVVERRFQELVHDARRSRTLSQLSMQLEDEEERDESMVEAAEFL